MDSIRIKRGVKAQLPSELPLGELAFCTDTRELFVGMGKGTKPKPVTNTEITEHLAEVSSQLNKSANEIANIKTNYAEKSDLQSLRIVQWAFRCVMLFSGFTYDVSGIEKIPKEKYCINGRRKNRY